MLSFILGILAILSPIAADVDSVRPKSRIIINTNYNTVMSEDEYNRLKQTEQIRSIDITPDTIKVTLYGKSIRIPNLSDYKKSYTANLLINNKRATYNKDEEPSHSPKTTQYNASDSCFYLTLGLSPKFQTKGEKMDLSVFLFCDSIPKAGDKFSIVPVTFDDDNPIKQWTKHTGNAAILQIGYFPKTKDVFPKELLSDSNKDKRVVLSTTEPTGEIEVMSIKKGKYQEQLEMKVKLNAEAVFYHEGLKIPINIKDGVINLYQIERQNLQPLFFEIDYAWPDTYVPVDAFR